MNKGLSVLTRCSILFLPWHKNVCPIAHFLILIDCQIHSPKVLVDKGPILTSFFLVFLYIFAYFILFTLCNNPMKYFPLHHKAMKLRGYLSKIPLSNVIQVLSFCCILCHLSLQTTLSVVLILEETLSIGMRQQLWKTEEQGRISLFTVSSDLCRHQLTMTAFLHCL